jgi:uncharacterized protein (TIGR01244 family)
MSSFRPVTPRFSVAPQIAPGDLAQAAAEGFSFVVCNRPDGEEAGQPDAATMQAAAEAAGLGFAHVPVAGGFSMQAVDATARALEEAGDARVLAWCRSGTRSVTLWALARAKDEVDAEELIRAAAGAGYDLSGMRPTLMGLAGR